MAMDLDRVSRTRESKSRGRGLGWHHAPLFLLGALLLVACPQPPPPAPTVGWLQPSRIGVLTVRGGQTTAVPHARRIEEGSEVRTPAGTRASLFLDSGAWVLLDGDSAIKVQPEAVQVLSGRAWIDARAGEEVKILADGERVQLSAQRAGLSISVVPDRQGGVTVYCAAGQVTWKAGDQGGRLQSGLSLLWQGGASKETAQALWDDWTFGLAEPGPLRPLEPAGVGQLTARRPGDFGTARTPLIVRQHEVHVRMVGDLAITEVEQTFFNPRSEHLEGLYSVRLPEAALLSEFSVGSEDGATARGVVTPAARAGVSSYSEFEGQLEWAGPGRYRGTIRNIQPGKTRTLKLRYVEWMPHVAHPSGGRRTYVYPMGQSATAQAGGAPNLGEFSLEVDVGSAQAGGLQAGLGARIEGNKVVLRGSDFRPRADFVLDLLDPPGRKADSLEAFRSPEVGDARYILMQPALDPGPPPASLDVALVLDVSAGNDEARLDLARSAALAILKLLSPADRVAVIAASSTAATLGRESIAPASKARIEELTAALSQQHPAGATNLGAALTRAVEILPRGKGVVIYLGDGRPTVGALTPRELMEHLLRLGQLPRFYAVAVGADANTELLGALCDTGTRSGVVRIDDRPEAVRAALHLIERAAQPSLTNVRAELGEEVDVVYPEVPVAVEGGDALPIVARLRRDRSDSPKTLVLHGLRDGKPFTTKLTLGVRELEEQGDLSRRWALARLGRLLQRGAGREAVLDIGTRYGVVTPFTALVAGGRGGEAYSQLVGDSDGGAFVPPALRGRAPADTPIALEAGVSTQPLRTLSLEQLYQRALSERQAPARLCYERKAAGRPGLSGRVNVHIKLAPDGVPKDAKVTSSTLRAKDVEECIERAVLGLKLPPAPDGKPHEVDFALQLNQAEHEDDGGGRCSAASRAYLAVRRALWRERLTSHPGAEGAMTVFREAEARCELRSWLDRRALLDLMRPHVGDTTNQVDLYHRFDDSPHRDEVQPYLRREILRAVRTEQDVRAAQLGLALDGGIDPELLAQELLKARSVDEEITIVRRFLDLSPQALALKLKLLGLLEKAGKKEEARRLIEQLRSDPGADAAVRQAVGEFLLRSGDGAEGARAFSEIVEFAPYDPWGRRRLGDLLRTHGFFEDAYREYQVLGWLTPDDNGVLLLLADAAEGLGRSDEALRLTGRVGEALGAKASQKGPAAWARALYAVRMARLRDEANKRGDKNLLGQLAVRGRSDGLGGYAGKLLVALTWAHPDANLQLFLSPPGRPPEPPPPKPRGRGKDKDKEPPAPVRPDGERAVLQGGAVGLEAQRYDRVEPGEWRLTVYKPTGAQGQGAYTGELILLLDEGTDKEAVRRIPITLPASAEAQSARFVLRDGQLTPEK